MQRFLNGLMDENTAEAYGIINIYKLNEILTLVSREPVSEQFQQELKIVLGSDFELNIFSEEETMHTIKFSSSKDDMVGFMQDVLKKKTQKDYEFDKFFANSIKPFFPLVGELKKKTKGINYFIQIQAPCPVCNGLGKSVIGKSKEEMDKLFKEKQRQVYDPDYKSELDIADLNFKEYSLHVALHNHVNGHVHLKCSECGEGFIE